MSSPLERESSEDDDVDDRDVAALVGVAAAAAIPQMPQAVAHAAAQVAPAALRFHPSTPVYILIRKFRQQGTSSRLRSKFTVA